MKTIHKAMAELLNEECTAACPKAIAARGHDWPVSGAWGVIIGVTRCKNCNVEARREHFPPTERGPNAD